MDVNIINYHEQGENLHCIFTAPLNTQNCNHIENELMEKLKDYKGQIIFDLKGVDYVASSFLRICVKMCKTAGSDKLRLVNVAPSIKKVFKIAGFDKFINIEEAG